MPQFEVVILGDEAQGASLRILHSALTFNAYLDIGVMDEFGNTQWVKVDREKFIDGLREVAVI